MKMFYWKDEELDQMLGTVERDGLIPYIEKYTPKPSKILESGAGAARYVKYLHDRGWDVVGLELLPETVQQVKQHWPELNMVEGDVADSPFSEGEFDGMISIGVVEHWVDGPEAPLKEMYRTLKPGGYAYITVPCHNVVRRIKHRIWWHQLVTNPRGTAAWLIKGKQRPNRLKKGYKYFVHTPYGPFFEYRMTPKEFASELKNVGFEIVHHVPNQEIDGFFHELNPRDILIKFDKWQFKTTKPVLWMNRQLSKWKFFHPHMQLAVVRRPAEKELADS